MVNPNAPPPSAVVDLNINPDVNFTKQNLNATPSPDVNFARQRRASADVVNRYSVGSNRLSVETGKPRRNSSTLGLPEVPARRASAIFEKKARFSVVGFARIFIRF